MRHFCKYFIGVHLLIINTPVISIQGQEESTYKVKPVSEIFWRITSFPLTWSTYFSYISSSLRLGGWQKLAACQFQSGTATLKMWDHLLHHTSSLKHFSPIRAVLLSDNTVLHKTLTQFHWLQGHEDVLLIYPHIKKQDFVVVINNLKWYPDASQ